MSSLVISPSHVRGRMPRAVTTADRTDKLFCGREDSPATPVQVPLAYFVLWQDQLSDEFGFSFFLLKNFFCSIAPHNDIIDVLQVFWSSTLFLCSLDESMADGWAVFPPMEHSIPGILDTPTSKSKLWPALCCLSDWEKCISDINCGTIWLPLTPVNTGIPTHAAQQHSEAAWLHSGHESLYQPLFPIRLLYWLHGAGRNIPSATFGW